MPSRYEFIVGPSRFIPPGLPTSPLPPRRRPAGASGDAVLRWGRPSDFQFASTSVGRVFVTQPAYDDLPEDDEQEERRRWRALVMIIKSKLESVETGIVEFEDEFMAQIVLPNGETMSEHARPMIARAYETGDMPPLLPYLKAIAPPTAMEG